MFLIASALAAAWIAPAGAQDANCQKDIDLLRGIADAVVRAAQYDSNQTSQQYGPDSAQALAAHARYQVVLHAAQTCPGPNCGFDDLSAFVYTAAAMARPLDPNAPPPQPLPYGQSVLQPPPPYLNRDLGPLYPQLYAIFVRIQTRTSCLVPPAPLPHPLPTDAPPGAKVAMCGPVIGFNGDVQNLHRGPDKPNDGLVWMRDHYLRWYRYVGPSKALYWDSGRPDGVDGRCQNGYGL